LYKQLMFFLTAVLAALMIAECSTGKDTPAKPAQPVISECELKAVSGDIGQYGGALVLMALSDPKTFNPVTASETSSTEIIDHIFSGLVEMNGETMDYEPALARSWSTSSDGRTWTFTLRKGLQWSDGAPLTADDVIFTFDVIFDPRIPNSTADVLSAKGHPIKARKIDEQTVQITTAEPFAPLLNGLTTPILPKHKLEQPVRAGNFNSAWGIDTEPQKIVGCGPFVLNRYIPGQKVVLSRNPYYWKMDTAGKRLPYLDDEKGWVKGMECVRMELGEPDESGRRRPVVIEGSEYVLDVDTVVVSIGQGPNPLLVQSTSGLETNKRGNITADPDTMATSIPGVYAGGDIVTGAATVIAAMGAGKIAAGNIDKYLKIKGL
jgi:ABC-type transport system substrate-binding protein